MSLARLLRRIAFLPLLVLFGSAAIAPASAEPIAVKSGFLSVPWDDPSHFRFTAAGFELSGLFTAVLQSPQRTCFSLCNPGTTVNLTAIAGGSWDFSRFSLGSATGAMVDGTRLLEGFGLRPESPLLAGTIRFDAGSIVLPPTPRDTYFAEARTPFVMTGNVQGYAADDLDGINPLFDVAVSGHGTAIVRFDVIGDRYGDVEAMYELSPVPEPASILLIGTGIAGFAARAALRRRPRR